MLNGCAINGHYWVCVGDLTDVLVNLTVQESQTGATNPYTNPSGVAFQPIQDAVAWSLTKRMSIQRPPTSALLDEEVCEVFRVAIDCALRHRFFQP